MSKLLVAAAAAMNGVSTETERAFYMVPLSQIEDNPYQTRITTDPDHVLSMAKSIYELRTELVATKGLQQPPIARLISWGGGIAALDRSIYTDPMRLRSMIGNREYVVELGFGHTRFRAFQVLAYGPAKLFPDQKWDTEQWPHDPMPEYAEMPLLLCYADDLTMWKHAVTENQQRKGITAIEEAMTLRTAMNQFHLTTEQAGEVFGWQRSTTANKLRLLDLPEEIQQRILNGSISERHGRALLPLKDHPQRMADALERSGGVLSSLEFAVKTELRGVENDKDRQRQEDYMRERGYRVVGEDEMYIRFERWGAVSTELLKKKHCGHGVCPCFAACHTLNAYNNDAIDEKAPNMVAACTEPEIAADKYKAMVLAAGAASKLKTDEKKAKAAAEARKTAERWEERTEKILAASGIRRLVGRHEFWRIVFDAFFGWQGDAVKKGNWSNMDEMEEALLSGLLRTTLEYKGDIEAYNTKRVDDLLTKLAEVVNGDKTSVFHQRGGESVPVL